MRAAQSFDKILLHRRPVDGRKQINGLAGIVAEEMEKGQLTERSLFVFVNKRGDTVKALYWDRTGFALWVKRLEKDRYRWPTRIDDEIILLSSKELNWLLDGIDLAKTRPHKTLSYSLQ